MAQIYFLLPTADGEAKLANAQALGIPLKLTHMAVGDGNGALPAPSRDRKTLVNEKRRAPINSLTQDPANASQIIAEQVIPEDVGGWWIREAGLFDEGGTMIYYSNIPETYKPQLAEGSGRQQIVRLVCLVTSGATVELKIDPAIVLATRAYADAQATLARAYADAQVALARTYSDTQIAAELAKLDTKQSVLVATTAPLAALSGLQTVDGVVLNAGARLLVKDQAVGKDNGIYVAAAAAWTRAADADASIEMTPGLFVTVEQGNTNADSVWQLVTDGPITLGTTALAFEMLGGKTGVAAGTYSRVTVNARGQVIGGVNTGTADDYGLSADLALPLSALPFPTIDTASNVIPASGATVGGTGGTVSIPAGYAFALGKEVVAGKTARQVMAGTVAWASPNLDVNSTYYLRAQFANGALMFYVQKGTDADTIPASLKGTPNAANGGGFDSTPLDMLIAKVVTGAAGSLPTVTVLANKATLSFQLQYTTPVTTDGTGGFFISYGVNVNWARTPKVVASLGYDITTITTTGALDRMLLNGQSVTRYRLSWDAQFDCNVSMVGGVYAQLNALGVA